MLSYQAYITLKVREKTFISISFSLNVWEWFYHVTFNTLCDIILRIINIRGTNL